MKKLLALSLALVMVFALWLRQWQTTGTLALLPVPVAPAALEHLLPLHPLMMIPLLT